MILFQHGADGSVEVHTSIQYPWLHLISSIDPEVSRLNAFSMIKRLNSKIIAALQQLMIIPRSPSPVPLEQRSIDDLTAEEARELVRRQNVRIFLPLNSNPAKAKPGTNRKRRGKAEVRKQVEAQKGAKLDHKRYQTCKGSEDSRWQGVHRPCERLRRWWCDG